MRVNHKATNRIADVSQKVISLNRERKSSGKNIRGTRQMRAEIAHDIMPIIIPIKTSLQGVIRTFTVFFYHSIAYSDKNYTDEYVEP